MMALGTKNLVIIAAYLFTTASAAYTCVQYRHSVFTTYYANICLPEGGSAPSSIGGVEEWWRPTKKTVLVPDCTQCAKWGPKNENDSKLSQEKYCAIAHSCIGRCNFIKSNTKCVTEDDCSKVYPRPEYAASECVNYGSNHSLRGKGTERAVPSALMRIISATNVRNVANVTKPDDLHLCCFYADRSSDDTETIHTLGMNAGLQCPSTDLGQHLDGVWNQDNMYNCQFFGPY